MSSPSSHRGFTLLETLVATGILVTALAGVAQLFVLGTQLTRQAGTSGAALIAAQDRLELLRAQAFTYDPSGLTVTAPALEPSPSSSLAYDIDPYVDWLDANGEVTDNAGDAVISRRWRVASLGATTPEAIAIEVCVFRIGAADADACLSTIRTRQP